MTFRFTAGAASRVARPASAVALLSLLVAVLVAMLAGCSSAPVPATRPTLDSSLTPFLPDPVPLSSPALAPDLARLHRLLLAGSDSAALERESEALLASAPTDGGAKLLLAETRLASGQAAAALATLGEIGTPAGAGVEVALVAGRSAEALDDLIAALSWYRLAGSLPGGSPGQTAARERAARIEPRAVEVLQRRGADLVARGRVDDAERVLAQLEQWRPSDAQTLELARAVAVARADPRRELGALRALAPARPEDLELQLRRGALEVEVGDSRTGLELLRALAARRPRDPRVAEELDRAKLAFRLANSPEPVRVAAERAQLSRADFARLVFWLVPDVRSGRSGTPRIASDILDHPAREEIVRVVNLGLLGVDQVRHLFEPDRAVRRGDALRALLLVPADRGWRTCAGANGGDVCAAAVACGLLAEPGECLPTAPLSGRDAVEWIRRVPESPGAEP